MPTLARARVAQSPEKRSRKGYEPVHIELERRHKLGHTKKSGKADITVCSRDGSPLLIIECKTWGREYAAEQAQMRLDAGQLFSYWKQDRRARYLCLYASRVGAKAIEYQSSIIAMIDSADDRAAQAKQPDETLTWERARDNDELVAVWQAKSKKQFASKGIFEDDFEPYNPGFVPIRIRDLRDFAPDDKGRVFDEFEEILRHNNISDRSNAFNRFISLVLAKIVDEDQAPEAIANFQVKDGIDTPESLHERLQTLYTRAMQHYLSEQVINYTLDDIDRILAHFPRQSSKDDLRRIYRELKFYTNNEFAFKEVYNEQLFLASGVVLEEIVRLFQGYRFRYNRRAQILGEFFELMLESGYKQSEGQFFTPTPVARFLLSSLPLEQVFHQRISAKEKRILPSVIDFACGSGHFVTEAIEDMDVWFKR